MKVLFVTTDWNTPYRIATGEYGGVGYYRCYGPAKALKKKGHTADVLGYELSVMVDKDNPFESYKKIFSEYDVVVVKQIDTTNGGRFIGACKEVGVPIVMDLDDLITELDEDNPAVDLGYAEDGEKRARAVASLSMVDGLFTSTQPLADEYKKVMEDVFKIDMPIYVLPNCCDPGLWKRIKRNNDGWIIVGWQGSITHDSDLALIVPVMKKLMLKYDKLLFSLTGGVRQVTYDNLFVNSFGQELLPRVVINKGTQSFNQFPEYLSAHQWDIGVCPLKDTKFTRGKSHIKWLENSLVRVPTVASKVYPYCEDVNGIATIEDGKTGLLASTADEWEVALTSLIEDKQKRFYLARDSHNFVKENWTYDKNIFFWEEALYSVINRGSSKA
jgi:glycosyltransferase involved in cell wall biosynthesis